MADGDSKILTGQIFDEDMEITVVELCELCAVDMNLVDKLIDEGILEPCGTHAGTRRLPYASVSRTRTVVRLQRDLGLNLPGAALALDLLDRIDELQARLRKRRLPG